jgi:hypothetical protein
MGLPDEDVGGPPATGRGGPPGGGAVGRGGPPAGAPGRPGGGAVGRGGRGGRAWGRSGARGARASVPGPAAAAGARPAPSSSRRGGRGGCSLPDDVTSRPGGGGGAGRLPVVGRGGAAGGEEGRGFQPSERVGAPPDVVGAGRGGAGGGAVGASGASAAAAGASARAAGASAAGADLGADGSALASALALDLALAAGAAAGRAGASREPPSVAGAALGLALPAERAGLAGLGSSGWTSRTMPSRWARRRTRSACASSIPEECVFTPIPNMRERSRHSLFVSPSSRASSWTRIFAAKVLSDQPFVFPSGADRTPTGAIRGSLSSRTPSPRDERCPPAARRLSVSPGHGRLVGTPHDDRQAPDTPRWCLCRATLRVLEVYGLQRDIPRDPSRSAPARTGVPCAGNRRTSGSARPDRHPSSPRSPSPPTAAAAP